MSHAAEAKFTTFLCPPVSVQTSPRLVPTTWTPTQTDFQNGLPGPHASPPRPPNPVIWVPCGNSAAFALYGGLSLNITVCIACASTFQSFWKLGRCGTMMSDKTELVSCHTAALPNMVDICGCLNLTRLKKKIQLLSCTSQAHFTCSTGPCD